MSNADRLPYVEAELNYLGRTAERPRYYAYETAAGDPPSVMPLEAHRMQIHDLRPIADELSLDIQGFALAEQRSVVRDFWDDDKVRNVYYPEAERFIAEVTGASRVFIFDHLQRRRVPGVADRSRSGPRQPATRVHVDHTDRSGPQRVRDLMGDEAEELLKGRVQVINLWRPILGEPLRDAPLAVCDSRTVEYPPISCREEHRLSRAGRRDLFGQIQPGAPLVLRARDAAHRGLAAEDRRHADRHFRRALCRTPRSPTRRRRPTLRRAKASNCARWSSTRRKRTVSEPLSAAMRERGFRAF